LDINIQHFVLLVGLNWFGSKPVLISLLLVFWKLNCSSNFYLN